LVTQVLRTVVVDDSEDIRALWCATLGRSLAFEICGVAADGPTAVEVVRREQPDVVLLDLSMPGMNGLAALPMLRAACPQAKVAVVSSVSRVQFAAEAIASGACGFLEKHLPVQTLATRLLEVLADPWPGATSSVADDASVGDQLVLVVEADTRHCALLEYLGSWLPYRIDVVPDLVAAMAALHSDDPCVVLVDISAPGVSETEAWRGMRQVCAAGGIPVVAIVPDGPEPEAAPLPAGVVAALRRPVDPQEFAELLADLTQRHPVAPGAAARGVAASVREAVATLAADLGPDEAGAVWAAFDRHTAERCAAAATAVAAGDLAELARLAHSVQGSAAAMGIPALAELAAALDRAARSRRHVAAARLSTALAGVFATVRPVAAEVFEHLDAAGSAGTPQADGVIPALPGPREPERLDPQAASGDRPRRLRDWLRSSGEPEAAGERRRHARR
jgi:CheY-like chemotaxis protein